MKTSVLMGAVGLVASAVAFPQYVERRQAWEPQEWIAPGPGDCKSRYNRRGK